MTPAALEAMLRRVVTDVVREELAAHGLQLQRPPQQCSFCGTGRKDVRTLVSTGDERMFICDVCIAVATQVVVERNPRDGISLTTLDEHAFVRSRDVERHGGLVYAVATVPELDARRLKIGYTTRPIEQRLEAFRTVSPTASLIGLWPAPSEAEGVAHGLIGGRLGTTEVFHVPDVTAALTAIDEELGKRWP